MGSQSSMCWGGSQKGLSVPNGVNLVDANKESWFKRTFSSPKLNILFEIEVMSGDQISVTHWLSDSTIYSKPGLNLKDVLVMHVAQVKKEKSNEYDAICRDSALDPTKTWIEVSYVSNGSQFIQNKYRSFKQMNISIESGIEYNVYLLGRWIKLDANSAFAKERRSLVKSSLSTTNSSYHIRTLSTRESNEPLSGQVKTDKLLTEAKKEKSKRLRSPQKNKASKKPKKSKSKSKSRKKSSKKPRSKHSSH